jgi:alkanesulfonate monooxygenase SsuD/methylene tetrahydromethanopterin reductase-like flavin-dependent oxidoreductase (luciferase family)
VKFGIYLSYKHPPSEDPVRKLDEHFQQIHLMRDLGFDSLWAGQHWVPSPFYMFQPIPFLARAAAEAGDMIIGTNVLLAPFYRPLDVAEVATTLDIITRGRFRLGLGLGYRDFEFENLGVPRRERVRRLVEMVDILRRLWTGERLTYEGQHYRLKDVSLTMPTVQRPHPPILIGGNLPAAVRRAAMIGDGWLASGNISLTSLVALHQEYEAARQESGRPAPAERYLFIDIYLANDRRTALADAATYIKVAYNAFTEWGNKKVESLEVPPEELAERFIVGSPDDCIRRLREYHRLAGFNHVLARVQLPGPTTSMPQSTVLRTIRLLGEEVAPALRALE